MEGEHCRQKEEQEQSPRHDRAQVICREHKMSVLCVASGEVLQWPEVGRGKTVEAGLGSTVKAHLLHVVVFGLHADEDTGKSDVLKPKREAVEFDVFESMDTKPKA